MLRNYLKIAWRNLRSRSGQSAINIAGLAVGLAACLLIALYVQDELSYDDFHENADRTYRVLREFDIPDLHTSITTTPSALAPALTENLPAVEKAVRVLNESPVVRYGDQTYVENQFLITEPGFFDLFSFPILRGEAILDRPHTVLITQEMAQKYFGSEDPLGRMLGVGNRELEVTGILADPPHNTHLPFDFIASLESPAPSWGPNNFSTYVRLRKGVSSDTVAARMAGLIQSITDPEDQREGNDFIPHLQPLTGIHLGQGVDVEVGSQGNILYVWLFMGLAAFIILLAGINYVNLSTARAAERAREIGLRKTLGAGRGQVVFQFLGESILTTLFSLAAALALLQLALPLMNELAGKSLELETLWGMNDLLAVAGAVLLIGVAAGLYPAMVMSGFKPARAVKGASQTGGDRFRSGLVVFQFVVSISLIAGTGIIYQQLQYMQSRDLGFKAENVLLLERARVLGNSVSTLKEELAALPGVEEVTSGYSVPGTFFINSMWQSTEPGTEARNMDYSYVDFHYTETLGIEMAAGRSFSRAFPSDSQAVILNEAAADEYGWSPREALGKRIGQGDREFEVIGVTENFHYESLHNEIYSLALFGPVSPPRYIAARINPAATSQLIGRVQQLWSEFSELPLEYSFLADDLSAQYRSEQRLARVFGVFALLAIFIGCLGLFGLATFMAMQRRKEIGIRKVLGATTAGIVRLLGSDFMKLILVGFLMATPLTWIAMDRWLADFAYHIDIGPMVFLLAGGIAMLVALLTVGWQSISAAVANPVESLKQE